MRVQLISKPCAASAKRLPQHQVGVSLQQTSGVPWTLQDGPSSQQRKRPAPHCGPTHFSNSERASACSESPLVPSLARAARSVLRYRLST